MGKLWDRAEQAIVSALGLQALGLALWLVLSRSFFPQESIGRAEEIMAYLLVWAIMIMSNQLASSDVRPDRVRDAAGGGSPGWPEIVNCAAAILFCSALVFYGWQIVETARALHARHSSVMPIPGWVSSLALPSAGALMLIRYILRLIAIAGASGWRKVELPRRPTATASRTPLSGLTLTSDSAADVLTAQQPEETCPISPRASHSLRRSSTSSRCASSSIPATSVFCPRPPIRSSPSSMSAKSRAGR
jgi:C4-dicarboxylate transporter DctQ subunit